MEISKKRRKAKAHKEKNLRKELKVRVLDSRDTKQYHNICKDIEDENRHENKKKYSKRCEQNTQKRCNKLVGTSWEGQSTIYVDDTILTIQIKGSANSNNENWRAQ